MMDLFLPGAAYAQAGPATGNTGSRMLFQLVLIVGFVLVFYFLLLRPQQKRQQQTQKMLGSLKTGDRVLTSGGIFGQILGLKDDVVVLKIADDVKVEVAKSSITGVLPKN